jgi:hypothetical protein
VIDQETQLRKQLALIRDQLEQEFPEASPQARSGCYSKAVTGVVAGAIVADSVASALDLPVLAGRAAHACLEQTAAELEAASRRPT